MRRTALPSVFPLEINMQSKPLTVGELSKRIRSGTDLVMAITTRKWELKANGKAEAIPGDRYVYEFLEDGAEINPPFSQKKPLPSYISFSTFIAFNFFG